jgi:hypothetical protein
MYQGDQFHNVMIAYPKSQNREFEAISKAVFPEISSCEKLIAINS